MAENPIKCRPADTNVAGVERIGSVFAGAALILSALARPSFGRIVAVIGGAALLGRGLTGHCALYRILGIDTALPEEAEPDPVLRASEDSVPASDPPSWTPVMGPAARHRPATD